MMRHSIVQSGAVPEGMNVETLLACYRENLAQAARRRGQRARRRALGPQGATPRVSE